MISLWQPIVNTVFIWLVVWAATNIGYEKKFNVAIGALATFATWVVYAISI